MGIGSWLKDKAKQVVETGADAVTLGGYSNAKEGLGFGESSSWIDAGREALGDPTAEWGKDAWGVVGDTFGVDAESLGFGPGPGPLNPYALGQEEFDQSRDQADFAYLEALNKSERAYTPGTIRDTTPIVAPTIRDINLGPTERVTASGPAAVERFGPAAVGRTDVGPSAEAVFQGVEKARFDADPQAAIREDQLGDLQRLRAAAAGEGPSAVQGEYAVALDRLADEQHALVNQATGEDKATARNEAQLAIGRQGLAAAQQAASLKAQEQQQAQQQLTGATQAVRTTDVNLASEMASLDQQANNLAAQLQTAVAQGNAQEINRLTALQGEINSRRAETQAKLDQESRAFGAEASNTASLDYTRRLDEAAAENAAAANKRDVDQAGLRLDRDTSAGAQSIDAQTTTVAQGVDRDVASDQAGRGAFQATTDAQLGALGRANEATGQGTTATKGKVDANAEGYDIALGERNAEEKRKAAAREGRRELITGVVSGMK